MTNKKIENKKYSTLYIVRHGQTLWNKKKLIQGHKDSPLTKKGIKQAKDLSRKLKKINFDSIYSSDLLRAKRTAEIINLEKNLAIQTTKLLRERYMDHFEGKSTSYYEEKLKKTIKDYQKLTKKERFKFKVEPQIENDEQIIERFITFLRQIAITKLGKKILIVSHGAIMRVFLIHLGYGTYENLSFGSIKNTAYIKLLSDGVDFFVKETEGVELL